MGILSLVREYQHDKWMDQAQVASLNDRAAVLHMVQLGSPMMQAFPFSGLCFGSYCCFCALCAYLSQGADDYYLIDTMQSAINVTNSIALFFSTLISSSSFDVSSQVFLDASVALCPSFLTGELLSWLSLCSYYL